MSTTPTADPAATPPDSAPPAYHAVCSTCGHVYPLWFDSCPDCAAIRRRQHVKNASELAQNIAEERQCPGCHRKGALRLWKLANHTSKRQCHYCGYQDRVGYWPEDVREW